MSRTRVRKARLPAPLWWRRRPRRVRTAFAQEVESRPWWYTTVLVIGFVDAADGRRRPLLRHQQRAATKSPRTNRSLPFSRWTSPPPFRRLADAPIEQGGTRRDPEERRRVPARAPARASTAPDSSVNFSVYIWEDGVVQQSSAATRSSESRARASRFGSSSTVLAAGKRRTTAFDELEKLGGRVEKFRTPKFGSWTRFHRRNHRRSIVIDGRIGFTGGMAVSDEWLGHAQDPDALGGRDVQAHGPAGEQPSGGVRRRVGGLHGRDLWSVPGCFQWRRLLRRSARHSSDAAASGVERFVHHINSPADDDHSMAYFFLLSIFAARERVLDQNALFHSRPAAAARARGKGAGRRRRAPAAARSAHRQPHGAAERAEPLSGTVSTPGSMIYEYQPTFTHTKYRVVDGRWSLDRVSQPQFALASAGRGECVRDPRSRARQVSSKSCLPAIVQPLQGNQERRVALAESARQDPAGRFPHPRSAVIMAGAGSMNPDGRRS